MERRECPGLQEFHCEWLPITPDMKPGKRPPDRPRPKFSDSDSPPGTAELQEVTDSDDEKADGARP